MAETIKLVRPDPKEDTVALLEGLLEDAKTGELQGIAVLHLYADKSYGVSSAGHYSPIEGVGVIEVLKHTMISNTWRR